MQRVLVTLIANAVALAVAAALFDGIRVGEADAVQQIVTLLLVGGVLGIVNAIVTPIVRLLSLPLIVLTLGLFLLLVNAAMLWLTTQLADAFDLRFVVDGFWTYVGGALVIALVGMAVSAVLDD
ncbi:MAG: phage holin family protein [Nocardioidaceae bacterium]|nr:phage holin family protein [Nocardioidaceae bacterium]MDQ3324546.1 phage holin family protein [Actinomycetota bacterium]